MSRTTELGTQEANLRQIETLQRKHYGALSQITSGQTLNSVSDDPIKYSRVSSDVTLSRKLIHLEKNANHAEVLATRSAESIESFNGVINRAQEISLSTSNQISTEALTSFLGEVEQLLHAGVGKLNSSYNDVYLFGGTEMSSPPFTTTKDANGNILTVSYVGNAGSSEFSISETLKLSPLTTGAQNNTLLAAMNELIALRDAMSSANFTGIEASHKNLIARGNEVIVTEASIGAKLSRVEVAHAQNSTDLRSADLRRGKEIATDVPKVLSGMQHYKHQLEAIFKDLGILNNTFLLNYL